MQINQRQVNAIRRLVNAARNQTTYTRECEEEHYKIGTDPPEKYTCSAEVEFQAPDEDELNAAALDVELLVLDTVPTLPSEIEIAELEDELAAAVIQEARA